MKITKALLAAILLMFCVGCSTPTLIEEVAAAATSIAGIADPAISGYLTFAQMEVNCATAPGTTQEIVDSCLATALSNYQLAWQKATPEEQLLISTVITAIEGIVNEANSSNPQQMVAARAKVANPAAKSPTASQFKKQFNSAAKAGGAKTI